MLPKHLFSKNNTFQATRKIHDWKSFMETRSTAVRRSIDKRNSIWSGTIRSALQKQSARTHDLPNEAERDEITTISDGKLLKPGSEANNYAWID